MSDRITKAMRAVMAALLALAMLPAAMLAAAPATEASALGNNTNYIGTVLGFTRADFVNWLESHEHDNYYLGTPYVPHPATGTDHMGFTPQGDPGFWTSPPQQVGMQCTGFVYHALVVAGWIGGNANVVSQAPNMDRYPGAGGWLTWGAANNVITYSYATKADMLASGVLEKGDIIWCFDGGTAHISDYHHVGVFWGERSDEDKFWHSSDKSWGNSVGVIGENKISGIDAKALGASPWIVFKLAPDPYVSGGQIELNKSSAAPQVTDNNRCYSLAGAQYGIYATDISAISVADWQDPALRPAAAEVLTTDAAGHAVSGRLPKGTYYVRELAAPQGYLLDHTTRAVIIDGLSAAGTYTLNVADFPDNDPVAVWAYKVDADTGQVYGYDPSLGRANLPQGSATLGGAEFTVEYYDWLGDPTGMDRAAVAAAAGAPLYTWVLQTDGNGGAYLDPAFLSPNSPDSLIIGLAGNAVVPRGTFVTWESKAPLGYNLPDPLEHHIEQYQGTALGTAVKAYNPSTQPDTVVRGDVALMKSFSADGARPGLMAPEAGITFEFFADGQYQAAAGGGYMPVPGAVAAFSITTDANGFADTSAIHVTDRMAEYGRYDVRPRTAQDKGGIPYGTYLAVQKNTPFGVNAAEPFLTAVDAQGKTHHYSVLNNSTGAGVRIVKRDIDTGLVVPYPATWSVRDLSTGQLVTMVDDRTTGSVADAWTSNANGDLILNERLPLGSYELIEVTAPAAGGRGYMRNTAPVRFDVTGFASWDSPLVVEFFDRATPGRIELAKADGGSKGGPVAGARYSVFADEDIATLDGTVYLQKDALVAELVTGRDGKASTGDLPLGRYRVCETASPEGWELERSPYYVNLSYTGQDATLVVKSLDVVERPTRVIVAKADAQSGLPVPGARYTITAEDRRTYDLAALKGAIGAALASKAAAASTGGVQASYTTDAAALQGAIDGLRGRGQGAQATAVVQESKTLQGVSRTRDIGLVISLCDGFAISVALDGAEVASLDGLGPVPASIEAVTDAAGRLCFEYVPHGKWVLKESSAPAGYATDAASYPFEVSGAGEVTGMPPVLNVTDAPLTASISKRDITDSEELAGAHLQVFADDGNGRPAGDALYEWVSTDAPHVITNISQGAYVLREVIAPDGWAVATDVAFKIGDSGLVQHVVMFDAPIKVSVSKRDITNGRELAGARLEVFADDGQGRPAGPALYSWVSTGTEHVITNIAKGGYILRETIAPAGYEKATDVRFAVTDSAEVQKVVMYDEPSPAPAPKGTGWDKTGSGAWGMLLAAAGLLALLSIASVWLAARATRRRPSPAPPEGPGAAGSAGASSGGACAGKADGS